MNPQPRESTGAMCSTWGHEKTPAARYVSCEGEGSYPYCDECAGALTRGGETDHGPVTVEITAEMVDRGVREMYRRLEGFLYHLPMEDPLWADHVAGILRAALNSPAPGQEQER